LLLNKQQLARPNDYYRKIHPAEAAEVDARLGAEKAKAETKARADAEAKAKPAASPKPPPASKPLPAPLPPT
jgi:NADH-quinone oxidoreductase subunit I